MSTTNGHGSPLKKECILVMAGALALAIFYFLPANKIWVDGQPGLYWKEFKQQRSRLDPETRKSQRYGSAYTRSREISSFFGQKGISQQVLVLVPGEHYFTARHFSYETPEPSVFYYYTGLKTVRPADANAADANWWVHLQNNRLVIDSVIDKKALADSIQSFKKADPGL
jgi:hypothetical protein